MQKQLVTNFADKIGRHSHEYMRGYFQAIRDLEQPEQTQRKTYKWSSESRKKLSDSQKAYWAKKREQEKTTV